MLQTQSIIKLTSWIITLPFYIYAFLKWHHFKGHFLIQKRFPQISYTIFFIAFLGQTLSLIEDCLFDYNISSQIAQQNISYAVLSLNFAISGLVLYRINLVYLKWKSIHEILKPRSSLSKIEPIQHTNSNSSRTVNPSKPIINNIASTSTVADTGTTDPNPNVNIATDLEQPNSITNKINPIADIHNNVYSSKLSLIILFFIFIGTLIPYLSNTLSITNDIASAIVITEFAILWILIAFSIFNLKHNKVQEGIGCIKECYAILISLLLQMLLQIQYDTHVRMLQYTTFFVLQYTIFVVLYIPLILLFKAEGTLNIKKFHYTTDGKIFQNASTCMDIMDIDNKDPDIVMELPTIQTQSSNRNINKKGSENGNIFINKCLFHFLYRNQGNVRLFSDYLRLCWCSENLLFVERVSIFYQIALTLQQNYQLSIIKIHNNNNNNGLAPLEMQNNLSSVGHSLTLSTVTTNSFSYRYSDTHSSNRISAVYINTANGELISPPNDLTEQTEKNKTDTPTMTPVTPIPKSFNDWNDIKSNKILKENVFASAAELKYIYRFEFEYLHEIYNHYKQIIDKNNDSGKDYVIGRYKKALYLISMEIYQQFISSDSATQVNLGYEVTKPLRYLLENDNKLDTFKDYDDFLRLFDGAVIETYRLLINVYNYRFRKYVKDRFKDVVFEKY